MSTPLMIEVDFALGSTVYIRTDVNQLPALVIGYHVTCVGTILYELQQGIARYVAYAVELSSECDDFLREKHA